MLVLTTEYKGIKYTAIPFSYSQNYYSFLNNSNILGVLYNIFSPDPMIIGMNVTEIASTSAPIPTRGFSMPMNIALLPAPFKS